eukprot:2961276-Lingulodinium_polyedra.AAC.1
MAARGSQREELNFERDLEEMVRLLRGSKRSKFAAVYDYVLADEAANVVDQFPRGVRTLDWKRF